MACVQTRPTMMVMSAEPTWAAHHQKSGDERVAASSCARAMSEDEDDLGGDGNAGDDVPLRQQILIDALMHHTRSYCAVRNLVATRPIVGQRVAARYLERCADLFCAEMRAATAARGQRTSLVRSDGAQRWKQAAHTIVVGAPHAVGARHVPIVDACVARVLDDAETRRVLGQYKYGGDALASDGAARMSARRTLVVQCTYMVGSLERYRVVAQAQADAEDDDDDADGGSGWRRIATTARNVHRVAWSDDTPLLDALRVDVALADAWPRLRRARAGRFGGTAAGGSLVRGVSVAWRAHSSTARYAPAAPRVTLLHVDDGVPPRRFALAPPHASLRDVDDASRRQTCRALIALTWNCKSSK